MVTETQHDCFAQDDYPLLKHPGIVVLREAISWPLVDKNGGFDSCTMGFVNKYQKEMYSRRRCIKAVS